LSTIVELLVSHYVAPQSSLLIWKQYSEEVSVLCVGSLQGYLREAKCHLAMGEIATAVIAYSKVLQLEPQNSVAKTEVSLICCRSSCHLSVTYARF